MLRSVFHVIIGYLAYSVCYDATLREIGIASEQLLKIYQIENLLSVFAQTFRRAERFANTCIGMSVHETNRT